MFPGSIAKLMALVVYSVRANTRDGNATPQPLELAPRNTCVVCSVFGIAMTQVVLHCAQNPRPVSEVVGLPRQFRMVRAIHLATRPQSGYAVLYSAICRTARVRTLSGSLS